MSRYPHHSQADGQLGLGTEVMRRSRKNDQRGRRIKWTHVPRRHLRERHSLDTVHGNGSKECPTEEKQRYIRSRHMECMQTTLTVQASMEADSTSTTVNTLPRPIRESGWIQHQGQPRDRTLMARERGSTGYSSDVPEAGQMAASLRKVPVTASIMTTSREAKENEGKYETQSLYHKQRGSSGNGGVG